MPVETNFTAFHGLEDVNAKNCQANRMASFSECFRHFKVSVLKLAEVGFYWTRVEDEVQCFACGIKRRGWADGEKPLDIHKATNPLCPLFAPDNDDAPVNAPSNVPIPVTGGKDYTWERCMRDVLQQTGHYNVNGTEETDLTDYSDVQIHPLNFPGVNVRPIRRPRPANNYNNLRLAGIPRGADGITVPFTAQVAAGERPLYPVYRNESKRLRSFYSFPLDKIVLVKRMCRCGFFYTGYSDTVVCHYCGLSLGEWRVEEDDPRLVHARWRPDCPLANVNGPVFVQLAQREMQVVGQ